MLVLNADDFGKSAEVNEAICRCFKHGWITSTTIMANARFAEEAARSAIVNGFGSNVGLHFNITEGCPLSASMAQCNHFCSDGMFKKTNASLLKRINPFDLERGAKFALIEEAMAQLRWYSDMGFTLNHIDSHTGVLEQASILHVVMTVFRKAGLKTMRRRASYPEMSIYNRAYSRTINSFIPNPLRSFSDGYRYIDNLDSYRALGDCELMFHPVMRNGEIRDALTGRLLEEVENLRDFEFVSYAEL